MKRFCRVKIIVVLMMSLGVLSVGFAEDMDSMWGPSVANLRSEDAGRGKPRQEEVTFKAYISAGKYDMEAQLIDKDDRVYPAYYIYIERL